MNEHFEIRCSLPNGSQEYLTSNFFGWTFKTLANSQKRADWFRSISAAMEVLQTIRMKMPEREGRLSIVRVETKEERVWPLTPLERLAHEAD